MNVFKGTRLSYEYAQTNAAAPEKVFPLLCPVREVDWLPGWKYLMIHSESGVAEAGCVFSTPNDAGPETIWMTTHYDPAAFTIAYAWVQPGLIATQLRISLAPAPGGQTRAHIRFVYTGLSPAGNATLAGYTPELFHEKMQGWETAINHYLRTGTLLQR